MFSLINPAVMNAEIVSFSGHAVNSPTLQEYVMPTKKTALNARRKMGSYLTDENGSETPAEQGGRQGRQILKRETHNFMYSLEESGGSDGTRTRGLRRDRPAL